MGEIVNKGFVRQPYFSLFYSKTITYQNLISILYSPTYPSTTEYYSASDFSAHTSSLAGYLHSHG